MLSSFTVRTVFAKPFTPPVFFSSGVAYDTLTLTRIDRLQDNLLLLIYLLLLGQSMVLEPFLFLSSNWWDGRCQCTSLTPARAHHRRPLFNMLYLQCDVIQFSH